MNIKESKTTQMYDCSLEVKHTQTAFKDPEILYLHMKLKMVKLIWRVKIMEKHVITYVLINHIIFAV